MYLTWKIYIVIILLFARGAFHVTSARSMGICHLYLKISLQLIVYWRIQRIERSPADRLLTLANLGLVSLAGTRISAGSLYFQPADWAFQPIFPHRPTTRCQSCPPHYNNNKIKMNERNFDLFWLSIFFLCFWLNMFIGKRF